MGEVFVAATKNMLTMFKNLTICAKLGSENQAMVVYELDIPNQNSAFRVAALMTFEADLIIGFEPFYDTSMIVKKATEQTSLSS